MDETTRRALLEKNQKLISMVIERAKRDFPDDIALIGLSGSFRTNDFHEKSDLDLIIVNCTDHGWGIARCFILEDVGYDIYCTPWKPRLEKAANLESAMVSCLTDMEVLYCAKPEHLETLRSYQKKALDTLALPIGKESLSRAEKSINAAKQHYAETLLASSPGAVRYAAGCAVSRLIEAVLHLNNTYIRRGIKRYLEELRGYSHIPDHFEALYFAVIDAGTPEKIRAAAQALLESVIRLYEQMRGEYLEKPVPTYENLHGTYGELWCNYRNKVLASVKAGDKSYAYHVALGAQDYLDEMEELFGTPHFDLMRHFNADDLPRFQAEFLRMMDAYLDEYRKVGRSVEHYDTFEELYEAFMKP